MKTVKELLDSGVLDTHENWSDRLGITLEDFQKLAQWLGSVWAEEMSVVEVYAEAVEVLPNMKVVAEFFNRPREIIEFSVGVFADVKEYAREGIIDHLLKMKELQEKLIELEPIEKLRREVKELTEYVEGIGFRVRHRIIKPKHAEAMANDYEDCDLWDMVLLLPEAEEENRDTFYNHWDKLLKEALVSEILDVMPEILKSNSKHAVSRWDEAFEVLKQRAPFEQIYAHLDDFEVIKHAIDKTSEGEYPEDYSAFKEYVWERFVGIEAVIGTFYPNAKTILEKFRKDASKNTGYKP